MKGKTTAIGWQAKGNWMSADELVYQQQMQDCQICKKDNKIGPNDKQQEQRKNILIFE